jgi:hypothetical protein
VVSNLGNLNVDVGGSSGSIGFGKNNGVGGTLDRE